MRSKKPTVTAVAGSVAGAVASGIAGSLATGCAPAPDHERPPVAGAAYGERVRFRCERDRGFLATFYGGQRPVCVIEAGDSVSYELPLISRTETGAVYSDGTMRLTLGAFPQAELYLGPGETLTNCEGVPSGP